MNDPLHEAKQIYSSLYSIPDFVVEYLSVIDVVKLSMSGLSNQTLAERLNLTVEDIQRDLKDFLDFEGFTSDLSYNPYAVYKENTAIEFYNNFNDIFTDVMKVYNACKKVDEMEQAINKYYK